MKLTPSIYLKGGLLSFLFFLVPCIFLMPDIFRQGLGISNYGINPLTVIPYSLGFLASIASLILAARTFSKPGAITRAFWLVAFLQLALLLIPDSQFDIVRYAHVLTGITLFIAEFSLGLWLSRTLLTYLLVILQALAGISAFVSLGHLLNLEAPSQLVFQVTFMTICILGAQRLEKK